MSFKIGDLLVDRVILGYFQTLKGEPLFTLTNLQSAQLQLSSDSNDLQSGSSETIKTIYRNRKCQFTATNAMLNLPIIAAMGGTDMQIASAEKALTIPKIITTATTTTELKDLTDASTQHLRVNAIGTNGTLGAAYELASGENTGAGTYTVSDGTLTITPNEGDTKWILSYDRTAKDNAARITVAGGKFPKNMKGTLRVIVYDPCEPDVARAAYIVMPNFQPSPDLDLNIQNDGTTLDFVGNAQVSYCSDEKIMFEVYMDSEDEDGDQI